jgi:YD repeat-containing protein
MEKQNRKSHLRSDGTEPALQSPIDQIQRFVVSGTVHNRDGMVAVGIVVTVLDQGLRQSWPLARTTTNADGAYELSYDAQQLRSGRLDADITFQIMSPDRAEMKVVEVIVDGVSSECHYPSPESSFTRQRQPMLISLLPQSQGRPFQSSIV